MSKLSKWWHDYQVRRARRFLYGAVDEDRAYQSSAVKDVLYDFFRNYDGSLPTVQLVPNGITTEAGQSVASDPANKKPADERKEVNPKDVFG